MISFGADAVTTTSLAPATGAMPATPALTAEQARTKTMLELLVFMLRGGEGLDIAPRYRDTLKRIYVAASARLAAGQFPVLTYWELQSIFVIARSRGAVALRGSGLSDFGAAANATVKNIQRALRGLGFTDIRVTGVLDARTVTAINGIFGGWDDAPTKLRSGALSARQVSANLPVVAKYLRQAIGGAQKMLNADQGE